ncbi:MAG: IS256 family transposase [Nitrospiria bacterium]
MLPATIVSIKQAFQEIKTFCVDAWEGDYRFAARQALKEILEHRMRNAVDDYLHQLQAQDIPDRRNGYYQRHLLTELGDLELSIPRTRTFNPIVLLKQFARRAAPVERMILLAFVLGLSTRKVGRALLPVLGEPISAQTVSRVAKQLDHAVEAYHQRPLSDRYEVLILDGIVLKRKTGAGAQKRTVLVALGIRPDGKREIIDFRQAFSESQYAWEGFLNHLYQQGLKGAGLKLIVTDGGKGLQAALPLVYGQIPAQRCWAHKTRNILNSVKKADQRKVKNTLHRISHAKNLVKAQQAASRFVQEWHIDYPKATACLLKDLPELLTFLRIRLTLDPTALRTTNAIERRFREVRRRTRPMGTFSDHTSIDRIMYSVFAYENLKEGTATPFLLTQTS